MGLPWDAPLVQSAADRRNHYRIRKQLLPMEAPAQRRPAAASEGREAKEELGTVAAGHKPGDDAGIAPRAPLALDGDAVVGAELLAQCGRENFVRTDRG